MFWLMLTITSFTPDYQITAREIFIPFETGEACELARQNMSQSKRHIGQRVDAAFCVTVPDKSLGEDNREPFPSNDKRTLNND